MVFLPNSPILCNYEVSAGEVLTFFCIQNQIPMEEGPIFKIKEKAEKIAAHNDMFLVDVEIKQEDMNVIWVLVDAEQGGVNVDTCSKMSRELAFYIDEHDLIQGSYRLNVSSPGLSRPLSDKRQYKKNIGRTAKVKYKSDNDYNQAEGILSDVTENHLSLNTGSDNPTQIAFSDIVETKIIPKI